MDSHQYIKMFFLSETTKPIELKFHRKTPLVSCLKIYTNCSGHMTKMATTPIYGKKPLKKSPQPEGRWPWDLVCSIEDVGPPKFVQILILG